MDNLNIVSPPEVPATPPRGNFWKQIGMLVIGTTVSLVLTFGTAQLIEKGQRAKDRRLTALMVMSNIETFAQQLDSLYAQMDEADSASTWLLTRPEEKLVLLPSDQLHEIINRAFVQDLITYDKSTENIFSNNIDTWKNMGNFQFIDNVGKCFSTMRLCEEMWNGNLDDIKTTTEEVAKRNADSTDKINSMIALIHDPAFRRLLQRQHMWRNWLRCSAEELRYYNRQNMAAIGISEQEVMDFLETRQKEIEVGVGAPNTEELRVTEPDSKQLDTYRRYDSIIGYSSELSR